MQKIIPPENQRLKEFRISKQINQGKFSKSLGLKQGSYSDIERGRNSLSYPIIKKLIEVYNINPNWLFLGIGSPTLDYQPAPPQIDPLEEAMEKFTRQLKIISEAEIQRRLNEVIK